MADYKEMRAEKLEYCEACKGHPSGFWVNDAAFWAAEEAAKQIAAKPGMMSRFIFHDIKVPILEEMRKLTVTLEQERDTLREVLETIADFAVGHGDVCEIIARRARNALCPRPERESDADEPGA